MSAPVPLTRHLTKSRFKLAVECPTKLCYTGKRECANTKNDDEFLVMLAEHGSHLPRNYRYGKTGQVSAYLAGVAAGAMTKSDR